MYKIHRALFLALICSFVSLRSMQQRRNVVTHESLEDAFSRFKSGSDTDALFQNGEAPLQVVLLDDTVAWVLEQHHDRGKESYATTFGDWERRLDGLFGDFVKKFSALRVTLDRVAMNAGGFAKLVGLPNLQELLLSGCSLNLPKAFGKIQDCARLQQLCLNGCQRIPEEVLYKVVSGEVLQDNLRILSLSRCVFGEKKSDIIRSVAEYQNLAELILTGADATEDDISILSQSPSLAASLKKLEAGHIEIQTIDSLRGFASLEEVYLRFPFDEEPFEELAADPSILSNLRKIVLYYDFGVLDPGVALDPDVIEALRARGIEAKQEELYC